jgi:xyloglucan-specific exo-beta-1,4-glucanase
MLTSTLLQASLAALALQTCTAAGEWKSIRIGGGGYVPGTFFHPKDPVMYAKTDVGGAYARATNPSAPGGIEWQPLLDWIDNSMYYSVAHLALDPNSGYTLYGLLGSLPSWGNCRLVKSTDGGQSFTVLVNESQWQVQCNGNGGDRGQGDRLVVSPGDNATIMVAGYDGRVYIARDGFANGGSSVHNVSLPGVVYGKSITARSVEFLPLTPGGGPGTPYAALATVPGVGLFWSLGPAYEDPSTWSQVTAFPAALNDTSRLLVDPSGPFLYVTATGGFAKLSVSGAPSSPSLAVEWMQLPLDHTYDGMTINPRNSNDVTFASIGTNSNTTFMRTVDGGKTFMYVNWTTNTTVPWSRTNTYGLKLNALASLRYDPHSNGTQIWASDFFGMWRCDNWDDALQGGQVLFTAYVWGDEEVCVNFVKQAPNGNAWTGVADDFGFVHNNGLDAYPDNIFPSTDDHNCAFGSDFTLTTTTLSNGQVVQEAIWVTGGDEYGAERNGWGGIHHWVGVSFDGGATMNETTYDATPMFWDSNADPYRVSVHPFNPDVAVITGYSTTPVVYTHDGGKTWGNTTTTTGETLMSVGPWGNFWWALPFARENNIAPSASWPSALRDDGKDRLRDVPATFYYYNGTSALFTSTDSGVTYNLTYNKFPSWNVPLFAIATPPRGTAAAGDIWAFAGWQLHHSTDGGNTFSQVWQFYSVKNTIAVGPLPNTTSSKTGLSTAELSARCAAKLPAEQRPKGAPRSIVNHDLAAGRSYAYAASTEASAAYVVYGVGTMSYTGGPGLYMSVDYGNTFTELTTPAQKLGDSASVVEASLQNPGLVFVGTDGRGAFYYDASSDILEALERCAA